MLAPVTVVKGDDVEKDGDGRCAVAAVKEDDIDDCGDGDGDGKCAPPTMGLLVVKRWGLTLRRVRGVAGALTA